MRPWRSLVVATLMLGGLGGCATYPPSTAIKASESSATLPTIRISSPLGGATDPSRGQAIEISIAAGKGRSTQDLAVGQDPVKFGDSSTTFNPPQTLTHEFDVASYDASWRARMFRPDDALGFELLLGVGYLSTDLTVSSATQSAADTLSAVNPNIGVGVLWRLLPTTQLHARAVLGVPLGDFDEFVRFEAFVVQELGRNVAVRAGYAYWRIRSEPGSQSGIKLNLSGPSLGLDLSF